MNKEQFEVAQAIMELSKAFADQMRKSMIRSGLLEDGYTLRVNVFPQYAINDDNSILRNTVEITNLTYEESFNAFEFLKKGWETIHEPEIDAGTADAECKRDPESEEDGAGTETEKPFAPDGLWISSADDTDYVQDWWSDVT